MTKIITATFEDGVLKPDTRLDLAPGTKVRLVMDSLLPDGSRNNTLADCERLCDETPVWSTEPHLTREQLHERARSEWAATSEQRQKAFEELERLRKEHPIDSGGERMTRDQLHERR